MFISNVTMFQFIQMLQFQSDSTKIKEGIRKENILNLLFNVNFLVLLYMELKKGLLMVIINLMSKKLAYHYSGMKNSRVKFSQQTT